MLLPILLHRLRVSGEVCEPLRNQRVLSGSVSPGPKLPIFDRRVPVTGKRQDVPRKG